MLGARVLGLFWVGAGFWDVGNMSEAIFQRSIEGMKP
jgi:hypothetical protein